MQARMKNPVLVLPETLQALLAVSNSIKDRGLSENIMDLVHLRVSQINGCSVCTDMGFRKLEKAGEANLGPGRLRLQANQGDPSDHDRGTVRVPGARSFRREVPCV